MFKTFLDKSDLRKIEFIRYMENRPLLKEYKETIIKELAISEFLLNRIVDELNVEFEETSLKEYFQLISTSNTVELIETGMTTSRQFEVHLLKESMAFSIITEIFLGRFKSVSHFSNEHFISDSPVYKKVKDIKGHFKQLDFTITKKFGFEGDEKKIRRFFLHLFTQAYQQDNQVYPSFVREKTNQFIQRLEKFLGKPLNEYSKLRISHFLNITFVRTKQKYYINTGPKVVSMNYLLRCQPIVNLIQQSFELDAKNVDIETLAYEYDEILSFLISEEILFVGDYLEQVIDQSFKAYSTEFVEAVVREFPKSEEILKENQQAIDLLHFRVQTFITEDNQESKTIDINYFVNNFPEYVNFCRNYLNDKKYHRELWALKEYYFYHYLLILVTTIPIKSYLPPIYLYVDFSFGKIYNQMIIENIKKITELHIVYQEYIDEKTDFILSDIYLERQKEIPSIVWLAPPRAVDWANFTNKLVEIRENKKAK
ncbi:hypothetical protein IGI37_003814 [Enterococcus sp. AZ194]|uniref:helix-turn-helix domain-containing protein n=1 Tax=Enterococcus sp. AZ194 TaxID=2774629 RepID=UPI003F270625